jgi:hypothetical protein
MQRINEFEFEIPVRAFVPLRAIEANLAEVIVLHRAATARIVHDLIITDK